MKLNRLRILHSLVAILLAACSAGCQLSDSALEAATSEVRDFAYERSRRIATNVLGADSGRMDRRTVAIAAADPGNQALSMMDNSSTLVVETALRATKAVGGGWSYDDATVVLCVRFVIDLLAPDVSLDDIACPKGEAREGEVEVTLGDVDEWRP